MSLKYLNDDFLLQLPAPTENEVSRIHKYDAYLDALTSANFGQVRQAIRKAFQFFITEQFQTTEELATRTYQQSTKLKIRYNSSLAEYLSHIRIRDRKACSLDLATGTGKSWVIYKLAHLMLADGIVDKVLVVCPSLTIEEELKRKFQAFSGKPHPVSDHDRVECLLSVAGYQKRQRTHIERGYLCGKHPRRLPENRFIHFGQLCRKRSTDAGGQ